MPYLHGRQCFAIAKIFRSPGDSNNDGALIAENCLIHIDKFYVLCVFDFEEASNNCWDHKLHFPLGNAESISFKKIRSASGKYSMGRLVIKGSFGSTAEKITMKMGLEYYNELVDASQSWP